MFTVHKIKDKTKYTKYYLFASWTIQISREATSFSSIYIYFFPFNLHLPLSLYYFGFLNCYECLFFVFPFFDSFFSFFYFGYRWSQFLFFFDFFGGIKGWPKESDARWDTVIQYYTIFTHSYTTYIHNLTWNKVNP